MSNKASSQVIAEITEKLLDKIDQVEKEKQDLQNFVNTLVPGLKSGEITLDRLQILENGDLRILPPPPSTNGKEVTDTPPLPEPQEKELVEASDGNG